MSFIGQNEFMKRHTAETSIEQPSELSFAEHLRTETKSYHTSLSPHAFVEAGIYTQAEIEDREISMNIKIDKLKRENKWKYSGERSQEITNLLYYIIGKKELLKPGDPQWDALVEPASHYDDFENGTDLVMVLHNYDTNENLPISIDTTTSQESAKRKHKRTANEIAHGNFRTLDYFVNPVNNQPVGEKEMPAVVICLEPDDLELIAAEWSRHKDGALKRVDLENTIQASILKQLQDQLIAVDKFAPETSRVTMKAALQRILDIFAP